MIRQVLANISATFRFYRRNRLALVMSLILLLITAMTMLPGLMFRTSVEHLEAIKMFSSNMHDFIFILSAGLGMLFLWHHHRNRSLKMVFTKPCLPEVWVFSGLLATILIAVALYLLTLVACLVMFLAWSIPVQWGLLYITLNNLCETVIALSYLWMLTALFNPIVSLAIILVFQEGTFYYFKIMLGAAINSTKSPATALLLKTLKLLDDALYLLVPTFSPFNDGKAHIYQTLRLSDGPLFNLLMTLSYAATLLLLFGLVSVYVLKRKRLT